MKQRRNLSGVYFREKVGDKFENICFEELSGEKQKEIVAKKGQEFVGGLAIALANTLNQIGEQLDLYKD